MISFRKIRKFTAFINKHNKREDTSQDLNNLVDINYYIHPAYREAEALRLYKEETGISKREAADIYKLACELGFVEGTPTQQEPTGAKRLLVTHKGTQLLAKGGVASAWVDYYDKKLIIAGSLTGGALLGNIEYIIHFFQWLIKLIPTQ